jgi:hypothetical protein
VSKTRTLGKLVEGGGRDLSTADDLRRFALLESFREHLRRGATSKRGITLDPNECEELLGQIDELILPASRRGRRSPIDAKQYVAYLADLAKRDYREHYGRERVSHKTEHRIYERAIELVEDSFPQWRGQVTLDPGVPGATDIRRYNWQRSEEMEIEGQAKFPDARKLMREAWNSQPGTRVRC